jgi:hypothetical protein
MASPSDKDLGKLLQAHGISYVRILSKLVMALLILVIGIVGSNVMFLVLVILFPYLVFMPIMRLIKRPRIELHENGIRTGENSWWWHEIDGLSATRQFEVMAIGVFHIGEYQLYRGSEKVLSINFDFAQTDKLLSLIQAKTAEFLVPVYLSKLERIGTVQFGNVTLSRQKISNGKMSLDVTDIGNAYLYSNQLRISKHRGILGSITVAFIEPIAHMKNYHILLFLINQMVQEAKANAAAL